MYTINGYWSTAGAHLEQQTTQGQAQEEGVETRCLLVLLSAAWGWLRVEAGISGWEPGNLCH